MVESHGATGTNGRPSVRRSETPAKPLATRRAARGSTPPEEWPTEEPCGQTLRSTTDIPEASTERAATGTTTHGDNDTKE
jgi:hypothetical protein